MKTVVIVGMLAFFVILIAVIVRDARQYFGGSHRRQMPSTWDRDADSGMTHGTWMPVIMNSDSSSPAGDGHCDSAASQSDSGGDSGGDCGGGAGADGGGSGGGADS